MTHRARTCGLLLAATLIASRLPAANTYIRASFFHASGPVAVTLNQSANLCVTNLENNTARVLLAYVNAQTTPNPNNLAPPQILAVREAALDPGGGVCLGKTGLELKSAVGLVGNNTWDGNTIAIVVPGGHFTGLADPNGNILQPGNIVQGGNTRDHGDVNGLHVASLQILSGGTTVLTPNMTLRSGTGGIAAGSGGST